MRTIPCVATVTAIRHNPAIRVFHTRLCRRGNSRKVVLVAAMRKLLLILNAVQSGTKFPGNPTACLRLAKLTVQHGC